MSEDKTIDPKSTSPDQLAQTQNVELSEQELGQASGGAVDAFQKLTTIPEESTSTANVSDFYYQKI